MIELELAETDPERARAAAEEMARKLLANTVIESFRVSVDGVMTRIAICHAAASVHAPRSAVPSHAGPVCVNAPSAVACGQPAPGWKHDDLQAARDACHATDPPSMPVAVGYVYGVYDLQFAPTPPRGVCHAGELHAGTACRW